MVDIKLSQLPASFLPPAKTDQIVGVASGPTDVLFNANQIQQSVLYNVPSGIVGDGVTDNLNALDAFRTTLPTLITDPLPQAVTISFGSPAVITLASHKFQWGQPVVFQSSSSGIVPGTTYYVMNAGLTTNTFQISLHNPVVNFDGDGAAVNTTGSQSGAPTVCTQGATWQQVIMPPGNYFTSQGVNVFSNGMAKRVKVEAFGAISNQIQLATQSYIDLAFISGTHLTALFQDIFTNQNATKVTLVTLGDTAKFKVGQWVLLMALDLQGVNSLPPNNHYFEFNQVNSINTGTGVITLNFRVRNSYRSTYPQYAPGSATVLPNGGPAMMVALAETWDQELEVHGLRITDQFPVVVNARRIKLVNCYFENLAPPPTVSKTWIAEGCTFVGAMEVDKLVEYLELKDCFWTGGSVGPFFQSTSIDIAFLEACNVDVVTGTPRNIYIKSCNIGTLYVGVQFYGATESIFIDTCRIDSLFVVTRLDDPGGVAASTNYVSNWTFTNGSLTRPLASGPCQWAVPGRKMFVRDIAGVYDNIGSPFVILDVRTDSVNTIIDTTLPAAPTSGIGALMYYPHPCSKISVHSSSGCAPIAALSQAPNDLPLFSFDKRLYTGSSATATAGISQPYVWGNLVTLTVNVIQAYTGVQQATLSAGITANGFDSALNVANMTQTIDLKTTGLRTITPGGVTGSVGADSITAYGNWISGAVTVAFSGTTVNDALTKQPIFEITITTDQGVTAYSEMQYSLNAGTNGPIVMSDTVITAAG